MQWRVSKGGWALRIHISCVCMWVYALYSNGYMCIIDCFLGLCLLLEVDSKVYVLVLKHVLIVAPICHISLELIRSLTSVTTLSAFVQ